jgi:TM2 domain-containing membrane protein YozV
MLTNENRHAMMISIKPQRGCIKMKNKGTAILLALLLGGLGAHKFYLGKSGSGILYLLFIWTFIPAILGLIDAIKYMLTDERSWNHKYNNQFINNQTM